jgi:rare lipoprotein A
MKEMPIIWPMRIIVFAAALLLLAAARALALSEEGLASWYGGKFQGRTTANGEIFDTNLMTAAHKSLPFGTIVKVTDLDTGQTTTVRINDRGPFVEGRIIDLSRAAAEELGMVGRGVARVSLEAVDFASQRELFAIQVGAFGLEKNAENARRIVAEAGFLATIEKTAVGISRVVARGLAEKDLAAAQSKLADLGFARVIVRKEKTGLPAPAGEEAGR